jgi:isopentenyl-diphosphate delta-isomerase
MTDGVPSITARKADHIALCADPSAKVAFRDRGTLLDDVQLIHEALPELALDEIDLTVTIAGKTLRAPVIISSMTGGTDEAAAINRDLAAVADKLGLGIGLGSQRAMLKHPEVAWTFDVRDVAPDVLLLGNLGVVQAREMSSRRVLQLVREIGADALCIHLNPAMEIVQAGGDRDFRGCLEAIRRLRQDLPVPLIVKETGCGLSWSVVQKLRAIGIEYVDVSGAGGTSWVGVETLRAEGGERTLGEGFWDWGIPTAASVAYAARAGLRAIATGGLKTGLDVAKAIALGAMAGGLAAPVLRAYKAGGREGAERFLIDVIRTLRAALLLTGSRTPCALQRSRHVVKGELASWLAVASTDTAL